MSSPSPLDLSIKRESEEMEWEQAEEEQGPHEQASALLYLCEVAENLERGAPVPSEELYAAGPSGIKSGQYAPESPDLLGFPERAAEDSPSSESDRGSGKLQIIIEEGDGEILTPHDYLPDDSIRANTHQELIRLLQFAAGKGLTRSSLSNMVAHVCSLYFMSNDGARRHCHLCHQRYITTGEASRYQLQIQHYVCQFGSVPEVRCPECHQRREDIQLAKVCPLCRWGYLRNKEPIDGGAIVMLPEYPLFQGDPKNLEDLKKLCKASSSS